MSASRNLSKSVHKRSMAMFAELVGAIVVIAVPWPAAIVEASATFTQITDAGNPILNDGSLLGVNGCTWIDYDADGWEDLFIADDDSSYLYRNLGGGSFQKITTGPLVTDTAFHRGVAWADYDNDGDIDALLTGQNETAIFENDGSGNFTKRPTSIWNSTDHRGYSPAWADYDNDGDLDVALTFPSPV